MKKQLTVLILTLLSFSTAFADTFIVTSNADSGPGSLREAISKASANGTAVTDFIHFNIPDISEEGRTIRLQSELPPLSSNLTIDGSTQPGTALGISGAKVTLYLDHYVQAPHFTYLYINRASHVQIFGLGFKFFENPNTVGGYNYGIVLRLSTNITIGAPGKGNLFSKVRTAITNSPENVFDDSSRYVTIQSNVIGLDSRNILAHRGYIFLERAADITIGGPTPEEGNLLFGAGIELRQAVVSGFFTRIQNNKFNHDWTGSIVYRHEGGKIVLIGNNTDDTTTTKTFILDNLISGGWPGGILLQFLKHKAVLQGNMLQTDFTGTTCLGTDNDLHIMGCNYVTVGGYKKEEENIFAGDIISQPRGVNIIRNQFGGIYAFHASPSAPFVKITTYDNGLITGKANNNAKIQLYTISCYPGCLGKTYLTTIHADATGVWSFPYTPDMPNIIATATDVDSSTTGFTEPQVDHLNIVKKDPTCGKSNGSITGMVVKSGTHIRWVNSRTMQVVSTDTNLVNVPAGDYIFMVSNGANGCPWNVNITLNDYAPPPTMPASITNTTCGQNNGSISVSPQNLAYKWMTERFDSIGNNYFVNKLPPGTYYLKASLPADTACNKTYGPYEIKNLSGPSLNLSALQVAPATCSAANGRITGITGAHTVGTVFTQWVDAQNKPVATGFDLINALPGSYRLKMKDQGTCDTILSPLITITDNGAITLDASAALIAPSKCVGGYGSIQNIKVAGGEQYKWIRTTDRATVGNTLDVFQLPAANYQLHVTNSTGCTATSAPIVVPSAAFIPIKVLDATSQNAVCGLANGSIKINTFDRDESIYTFRWVATGANNPVGTGTGIMNLAGNTYSLMAVDSNGCESNIYTATIKSFQKPQLDYGQLTITDDLCNLKNGSIANMAIQGLVGPTTYTWVNQAGNTVGQNLNLPNINSGTYTLTVTDAGHCTFQSRALLVNNKEQVVAKPVYDDLIIPRFTPATLTLKSQPQGILRLYADALGTQLLQESNTGQFKTQNISADTVFYIRQVVGTCLSPAHPIRIQVVDRSYFTIPSAFTPNADGRNDKLTVRAIGYIDLNSFIIFNAWGEQVFKTTKMNDGWDGRFKQQLQPSATYVWIAEGRDINGNSIRDKGTFVLIR